MRYRQLDKTGAAASAVSLILPDVRMRESERIRLVQTALEAGINTFEIQSANPEVALAVGKALGDLDRRLVNIGLRLTWSRQAPAGRPTGSAALAGLIQAVAGQSGLGWIDMAVIDAPDSEPPPPEAVYVLQGERAMSRIRLLGVAGEGEVAREYVKTGLFDILAMRFNVHSGWAARNRVKEAAGMGLAVIAYDRYPSRQPPDLPTALTKAGGFLGRLLTGKASAPGGGDTPYAFLNETPNWSPEQICLAFALTEPSLTTVQIDPLDVDELKALAEVPERELPSGLAAQIEMARFSHIERERPVDKRKLRA